MTKPLTYKKEFLFQDAAWEVAYSLFQMRTKKDISLKQLSSEVDIPINEIDALESNYGDINFHQVAILLDFYNGKISGYADCFPNLPKGYYDKYFN